MPIIRRNYCIYATLGIFHSVWMTVWYAGCTLRTGQSCIQSDKYQVSHRCSNFSWWWALSCPKHVEKRNKHTKKNCAPSWLYLQDYTGMHGQQDITQRKVICVEIIDSVSLPGSINYLILEVFPWYFDTANLKYKTPYNIAFVSNNWTFFFGFIL